MVEIQVRVSAELIEEVLRTGGKVRGSRCIDGLPADAELVDAEMPFDINAREVLLVFKSASTPDGPVQFVTPAFQVVHEADGL